MENKEGYKEGIESYRRRLITEIEGINNIASRNILGSNENTSYDLKAIVRSFRLSLEKCNMYIGYIEEIVEKRIKDDEVARQISHRDSKVISTLRENTNK